MKNMITDKFACPKCKIKVPYRKALFMTKFTNVRCSNCSSQIIPNQKILEKIGGSGGASVAVLAFLVYRIFGIVGATIVIIIGYIFAVLITIQTTTFELKK